MLPLPFGIFSQPGSFLGLGDYVAMRITPIVPTSTKDKALASNIGNPT
jgi:hypothetical protein